MEHRIYLYGESHAREEIMQYELKEWQNYYHNHGFRHFFVEYPYYTSLLLNMWMKDDKDDILLAVYDNWAGSLAHCEATLDFYRSLKATCPETVFHGTDVGHQYTTTGAMALRILEERGMKDTEEYRLSEEAIEQGFYYRGGEKKDRNYREIKMAENFIKTYDRIGRPYIMGVYGSNHMKTDSYVGDATPRFIVRLLQKYGEDVTVENLTAKFAEFKKD